jgi:hypothetical protein
MHGRLAGGPGIRRLSRRDFVALTAAAGGAALVASLPAVASQPAGPPGAAGRVVLPAQPSHNPAYLARGTARGGLVLWTRRGAGELAGFRLNAAGRQVWELCDGASSAEEIAAAYARRAHRPAGEAAPFLAGLLELGVVAAGAVVVTVGEFPHPPEGGCYHRRTDRDPGGVG